MKDVQMPHYRTPMVEKTQELEKAGFKEEFQICETGLKALSDNKVYKPEDITILEHFRFEGISNPDDMAVLYVVETKEGRKGIVIDAFGLYANGDLLGFMNKVKDETADHI